jgi:hypothetical protein
LDVSFSFWIFVSRRAAFFRLLLLLVEKTLVCALARRGVLADSDVSFFIKFCVDLRTACVKTRNIFKFDVCSKDKELGRQPQCKFFSQRWYFEALRRIVTNNVMMDRWIQFRVLCAFVDKRKYLLFTYR